MPSPKVWFITGSSSGFGRNMTELVLEKGDIAVATLRKPEVIADLAAKYSSDQLLVIKLDVSKPQEVTAAFAEAVQKYGRIDVVFNNAGYGILAEVEGTPDEQARAMFDVNFFGAANVSREAVRIFRDVNKPQGGRLLQMSSVAVYASSAAMGYYCASKRAFEGLSEGLAAELDPDWNIKITIIESGGFSTSGLRSIFRVDPHPAYTKPTLTPAIVRKYLASDTFPPGTPSAAGAVDVIYKIAALENPPLNFPLGKDAVGTAKKKTGELLANAEQFASWSEDLPVAA
ncbi:NAD-P-binding protein [Fomitopsis serialis]|uniref:NAD-P-binding protein n=1 Tax=Fomitopsis serialis TaxID=139415 RepID=UPI002007910C|nr:NAD-P-binding protein [Neoantrodia serialis]KAH9930129.1 NAD-P-binding protein [Neoantrodia serialis]